MDDELITIKALCESEPDMRPDWYYRGIRAGMLPVIQTGPKHGYRMTRELWARYKRGEQLPNRYFIRRGKNAA